MIALGGDDQTGHSVVMLVVMLVMMLVTAGHDQDGQRGTAPVSDIQLK